MTARQYFAAEKARAEAAKRADELEEVASFQEQQLAGINVPRMGESLRKGVLVKAREAAEWAKVGEQEISRRMELLEESLASADFTDLALDTLDQHVFEGTLAAVETQFADQPLIRARLLQTLADTMRDLGLIEQASTPQEKALELRRTILGNENEDTLFSINSMGRLRSVQGKLEEAESLYREAMERARASKGEDYVGTMIALGNLASVLQRQGKLDEAEALQKGSLEHRQRELGPEHPDTLVAMNSLALLLQERGRFKEAEALNRRALELRIKVLGPDNPETLVSLNNLGYVLRRLGRNVEAEDCYRRTLEARRQVLGNDHWHTILSVNNVGSVLRDQGKLDEALQYFKEAFESSRRVLGDEHQRTALWANNYAGVLNQLGRYEEALQILREMEPAARKVWIGENDPWLGNFFVGIGEALAGLKRFPESEKTLSDAYRRVSVKGERHEMTIRAVQALSRLYEQWHAAEPDKGYDAKAAEWRAKLEAAKSPPEAAPGTDN